MAKFSIEYTIHLGDRVCFNVRDDEHMCDRIQTGTVQDISHLPDVFVEGFDILRGGKYTRWKKDIGKLDILASNYEDAGTNTSMNFGDDEEVEFVHKGDIGTKEFDEIEYVNHKNLVRHQ